MLDQSHSPGTLVFWRQQSLVGDAIFSLKFALKVTHPLPFEHNSEIPMRSSQGGRLRQAVWVKLRFQSIEKSRLIRLTAENLCPSATVVCASTMVRWRRNTRCYQQRWWWSKIADHTYGLFDINNVGCSGSLLIRRMTDFSVTCMWLGASHARCAIIVLLTTMRVQNYAGSRIAE